MVETGRFYAKLFMSICTRENSQPAQIFSFCRVFTRIITRLDTIDTSGSSFLI